MNISQYKKDVCKCNHCGSQVVIKAGANICLACLAIGAMKYTRINFTKLDMMKAKIEINAYSLFDFLVEEYKGRVPVAIAELDKFDYIPEDIADLMMQLARCNPKKNYSGKSLLPFEVLISSDILRDRDMIEHDYTYAHGEGYRFCPEVLEFREGIEFVLVKGKETDDVPVIDIDESYGIDRLRKMKKHFGWNFPATILLDWDRTKSVRVHFATGSGLREKMKGLNIRCVVKCARKGRRNWKNDKV